jgi:hypothetical protein
MKKFLQSLEITFRRDPTNFRPRVNKLNSGKDKEQKGLCPVDVCDHPLMAFFVQLREILPRGVNGFGCSEMQGEMCDKYTALGPGYQRPFCWFLESCLL